MTISSDFRADAGYLQRTGIRTGWQDWLLFSMVLMMLTAGSVSAFINNTATAAIFLPIVLGASQRIHASPSKLLMPLSYASMFGGVCTLIGTSTNILVRSIAKRTAEGAFSMFELLPVGLVFFASGTLCMAVLGMRTVPNRRKPGDLTAKRPEPSCAIRDGTFLARDPYPSLDNPAPWGRPDTW